MGKCVICGEPSGYYPLCDKHFRERDEGKITKCPECGVWHYTNDAHVCGYSKDLIKQLENSKIEKKILDDQSSVCAVCGTKTGGSALCKKCYDEMLNYVDTLNRKSSMHSLRDYYYNLKDSIFAMKDIDIAKSNCNRLIAIAVACEVWCDDTSLTDRVYKDVQTLIANKIIKPDDKYKELRQERDESKTKILTAQDGHILKSQIEMQIDDILYNSYILHCYEKPIEEIREVRRKCDWFIPIMNGKGIYIEYFGMNTPEYKKKREEKEALYKKYNVPYIAIEKDEPKESSSFKSNLIREITRLAVEYYGGMPEWTIKR